MAAAQRDGSILRSTSMDRVTSYGSFGGASLDRTTSFDSGDNSGSPRSASSFEVSALEAVASNAESSCRRTQARAAYSRPCNALA